MQFRLLLNSRDWQVRYPQAGAVGGWSEWEPLSRGDALDYIERGLSFNVVA